MRPEKKYMVEEVSKHLDKSNYFFLTNYERITVSETAELRENLSEVGAEFHVIKNRIFDVALKERDGEMPDFGEWLNGQTAIIVGGENAPGAAKVISKFFKDKDKVEVKVGFLRGKLLTPDNVNELGKLPPREVLLAQLLGLLNTPAQQMVTVMNAVPQSVLNLLEAKRKADGGE